MVLHYLRVPPTLTQHLQEMDRYRYRKKVLETATEEDGWTEKGIIEGTDRYKCNCHIIESRLAV